MAGGHKRSRQIIDIASFLEDATQVHKLIIRQKCKVGVGGSHYEVLENVHEALIVAIKEVTGEDPPWAKWGTTGPVIPSD